MKSNCYARRKVDYAICIKVILIMFSIRGVAQQDYTQVYNIY